MNVKDKNRLGHTGRRFCSGMVLILYIATLCSFWVQANASETVHDAVYAEISSQNILHYTNHYQAKNTSEDLQKLIAEVLDSEEEEDKIKHKLRSFTPLAVSLLFNISEPAQEPVFIPYNSGDAISPHQPCYIRYCSLKIPS